MAQGSFESGRARGSALKSKYEMTADGLDTVTTGMSYSNCTDVAHWPGLGLVLSIDPHSEDVVVAQVEPKSVAYLDGRMRPGDRIIFVDDDACRGLNIQGLSKLISEKEDLPAVFHVTALDFQGADAHACTFPVKLEPRQADASSMELWSPRPYTRRSVQQRSCSPTRSTLIQAAGPDLRRSQPYTRNLVVSPRAQVPAQSAGIGLLIWREEQSGSILVKEVVHGGPADRSQDIQVGDKILSVDGRKVKGMRIADVMTLIKGASGSSIDIKLERKAPPPSKTVYKFHVPLVRELMGAEQVPLRSHSLSPLRSQSPEPWRLGHPPLYLMGAEQFPLRSHSLSPLRSQSPHPARLEHLPAYLRSMPDRNFFAAEAESQVSGEASHQPSSLQTPRSQFLETPVDQPQYFDEEAVPSEHPSIAPAQPFDVSLNHHSTNIVLNEPQVAEPDLSSFANFTGNGYE
eukprot:16377-Rhodomonas_salina.1